MKLFIKFIKTILMISIILITVYIFNVILVGYRNNYLNGFTRAELDLYSSKFTRDEENMYGNIVSYKIESPEYNDAMFYKMVEVKPHTAYRVTCKVKTENVETEVFPSDSGAHICVLDTMEKSPSLIGTREWQELEFYFNSKNRTAVNIAFRLGGSDANCKGNVWFADFKLEQGAAVTDNKWNFACFIFKNVDVKLDQMIRLSMTNEETVTVKRNISRFETFIERYSNGNIDAECDIIEIDIPITSVAYDDENGYYIAGANISSMINQYMEEKDYQHIFAIAKFGNEDIAIPVNDWLGLGSMTFQGIGFSNIRIPGDSTNRVYQLTRYNQFPEEVFVHEFLHDLERISKEAKIERPSLHGYEEYGYESDDMVGLKAWYEAYMQNAIKVDDGFTGISPVVYTMKPIGKEYLVYSLEREFIKEPANIFEEVFIMFKTSVETFISKLGGN